MTLAGRDPRQREHPSNMSYLLGLFDAWDFSWKKTVLGLRAVDIKAACREAGAGRGRTHLMEPSCLLV